VNVNESERERTGIICRQFYGVDGVAAIFRGAHKLNSWFLEEMWAILLQSDTAPF